MSIPFPFFIIFHSFYLYLPLRDEGCVLLLQDTDTGRHIWFLGFPVAFALSCRFYYLLESGLKRYHPPKLTPTSRVPLYALLLPLPAFAL